MTTVKALLISLLIVLAGTGGLYATSNNDIERLVSNTDGTYSVYIIAEEEVAHDYFDEVFELRNVSSVRGQTNLEGVIFEDITDMPMFYVYDTEAKVFETKEYGALLEFLEDN